MPPSPRLIVLISGKRKCGKDYIATQMCAQLNENVTASIVHLSAPIKLAYASEHNLDYNLLMSDGAYKERHRLAMVEWSERVRAGDSDYFCRLAVPSVHPSVLIVADCRRPTDIAYFETHFSQCSHVFRLRIHASDDVRRTRSFVYTVGIDDCATECALDEYTKWDMVFDNNLTSHDHTYLSPIMTKIEQYL